MLTKSMHRDVYPAIDPTRNPDVRAEGKVAIISGASGGLGFVSFCWFYSLAYDSIRRLI